MALCTIHSSLLDFRFRSRELKPFNRSEYVKVQEKEKEQAAKILTEKKNIANKQGFNGAASLKEEWKP